jgi:hypothetical protein
MMVNYKCFIVFIAFAVNFSCCSSGRKNDSPEFSDTREEMLPDSKKVYDFKDAVEKNFIEVSADGLGTFRFINVNIRNKSNVEVEVSVPSGLYFENPDSKAQSLISAKKEKNIVLAPRESIKYRTRSFCTNVKQNVPGFLKDWNFNSNYSGGLDAVIEFYGDYEIPINEWLESKNSKFKSEESRMLFFQTVIWYHEGGQYQEILLMLKNSVFKNDINEAKIWLEEIHRDASNLAEVIRSRDTEKMKEWLRQSLLVAKVSLSNAENRIKAGFKDLNSLLTRDD